MPSPLPKRTNFKDESTECSLCLGAFEESSDAIITLRCGHRFHRNCIIEQIEVGSMTALNDDQRLLFNGVQCAICKAIFGEDDHPDLPKDLIRSTHKLRSKVNDLIDQHKLLEETKEENQGKEVQSRDYLYREAMRKHAFYLCSHCNDPYYGGTIDCADAFRPPAVETTGRSNSDSNSNSTAPERKLCSGCAPQSQTVCRNPSEHGAFLTWKCRYCCQPGTYVCYGNVHFCKDCHDKNSRGEVLTPVSCPGDSCPYPKPEASSGFHTNGPTQDCEQVYSCSLCESIPVDASAETWTTEPGSRNFVVNPSGEDGLRGWVSNGSPWMVESGAPGAYPSRLLPTPVVGEAEREPITTNFVSSFRFSTMEQRIDLAKFLRLGEAATRTPSPVVRIEVSARYTRRWDCPSVFRLEAVLLDGREARAPPLSTGVVEAGVHWERASLVFDLGPLAEIPGRFGRFPKLVVSVSGKDSRFWAGNFGSKVADISVRVLGRTPEEIETMVLSEEEAVSTGGTHRFIGPARGTDALGVVRGGAPGGGCLRGLCQQRMVAAFESHQPLPCRRCLSSPGDGSRNGFAGKLGGDGERTRAIPPPSIAEGCTAAGTVHIRGHGIDAAGPFRGIGWGRAGAWLVGNGTPDRTRRTHARTHRQTQQEQKTKCRRSRAGRDGSERATKHRQRHQSAIRQRPLDRQTSEQAMVRPLSQSMGTRDSLPAYHAAHGAFC